ncbi:hypothetical protein RJ640_010551 [Escallonia rubra]|uniref:DUF4283 domain-containing protein n=1 Tax=Escallonia rubra TaxID=112253 RepID=A0AA88QNC9_9ASTE|nr:hypothetical protein RJ640_010551 [Escallonia rubra]
MELVLHDNPWNIRGALLVLRRWRPLLTIAQVEFLVVDLWVQLHLIPLELFSFGMAGILGSAFGHLIDIDRFSIRQMRRDYFRVLVRVNLDDPFITGVFLCSEAVRADRITMLAYREAPCFTVALRAFTNTGWNRTSRLNVPDVSEEPALVYGTNSGSNVDSEEDLIVILDGAWVNLATDAVASPLSDGFFTAESSASFSPGLGDCELPESEDPGVAAVVPVQMLTWLTLILCMLTVPQRMPRRLWMVTQQRHACLHLMINPDSLEAVQSPPATHYLPHDFALVNQYGSFLPAGYTGTYDAEAGPSRPSHAQALPLSSDSPSTSPSFVLRAPEFSESSSDDQQLEDTAITNFMLWCHEQPRTFLHLG